MWEKKAKIKELWARQQIADSDVDYGLWERERESLIQFARFTPGCVFTVDVFKGVYDFASDNFVSMFGYHPDRIRTIQKQGDLLNERIHPDDRDQLLDFQIEHGQFIYSLPPGQRNDYRQTFQWRMQNAKRDYVNVISRQQVIRKDRLGRAWIIMGVMDLSPDQSYEGPVKRTVVHSKTGEIVCPPVLSLKVTSRLSEREQEILRLIAQGLLSKEIAVRLGLSIYMVHNHRKNILVKLHADNSIEAIRNAVDAGLLRPENTF